jgi:hypothetical protein
MHLYRCGVFRHNVEIWGLCRGGATTQTPITPRCMLDVTLFGVRLSMSVDLFLLSSVL